MSEDQDLMVSKSQVLAGLAVGAAVLVIVLKGKVSSINIRVVKPDTVMVDPLVYVDGAVVGTGSVVWKAPAAGTYTVTGQDRPGGDNPSPGVLYYQAPVPQTVTVTESRTVTVTLTYTIVETAGEYRNLTAAYA